MRNIKKVLAAILAATMVMGTAMTAFATSGTTGNEGTTESSTSSSSSSDDSSSSSSVSYAEQYVQSASAVITVAGSAVQTTVGGTYAATKVQGCAVTTPAADLATALGLTSGQKAAIIIYDTDEKKSSAAMVSINAAIAAMGGGDLVASLNIDLGARQSGKWVTLSSGEAALKVGLPKTADQTKTYKIVKVVSGGEITILEDEDSNPATVTFPVGAGLGTYSIVAQ